MCGPGSAETAQANASSTLAADTNSDFLSRFAGQTDTINSLDQILQNVQNGKLLPGFSSPTLAALNTQAIDTTAANYRAAQQVTNNTNAAKGTSSGLETGTQAQENATIASNAAGQLSSQQQQIQLANQGQAEQNTQLALGGYQTLAGIQNPLGFGGLATQAGNQAFQQQDTIQQEKNQEQADIAGGVAGLAMDAATFGAGGMAGLGASPAGASQPGAFFQGGFNALAG
jgi:hypothetical protein